MKKPTPSADLVQSLANQYLERLAIDPDLTLDNFLKDAEITQHRDVYAEHINGKIGGMLTSRTGAYEQGAARVA